jgi:N-acetylneuraminic acid mutarotase
MIVWGGETSYIYGALNSGGRYNPTANTWTSVATVGAPARRVGHIAVWTGNEMVIWGGYYQETSSPPVYMIEGGRYNSITNSWTLFSVNDGPQGRADSVAVWTGRELLMWGGANLVEFSQIGGRYLPRTNQWILTQPEGAPVGRTGHTAVWTGHEMVIWGGEKYSLIEAGGRYRLENDPGCFYVNMPLVTKYGQ